MYSKRSVNRVKLLKKRLKVAFIFSILIFITFNFIFATNDVKDTKSILVRNGDTLWGLATKICNETEDLNVLEVIYEIKKLNNMLDSNIYEGQELIVYIY